MNVESFSRALRGNLFCEECSTKLNVLSRKKTCYFCKHSFCQVCITRREDNKPCCRKCQILTARPLDRNKLLNLRSRDLINYLTAKKIPTNGCVEKEDLVNVLIRAVNNSCFHPSSTACLDSNTPSNNCPSSPRNCSNSAPSQIPETGINVVNDGIRITGHDPAETEISEEIQQRDRLSNCNQRGDEGDTTTNQTTSCFNPQLDEGAEVRHNLPLNKPLMLCDIKSRSDLDALSIKQLKELLMRNRTDFKGCVERDELIQKANRLWSDYTLSRKDLENLTLEELCKICMDAPIECVLLDCGHMATCTSCGKQLCECPICRQFVVRCVRTFKA